jgi:prepilin-type N-terminal cleavage/methylation domain-containing protein
MLDDAGPLQINRWSSAAKLRLTKPTSLPLRRSCLHGFTLVELMVSVGVLVMLVLLATQLLNSAATTTTLGHKKMDADSQARELFDRMAIDVMQMVKRSDVYYHLKASTSATDCPSTECGTQAGNDEMAFYSNVPGYYASDSTGSQQSTVSIVGYRINSSATTLANRMERLGAGLVWNGVSTSNPPNMPVVFWATLNPWTSTIATTSTLDIVGPQVFRFEYYYLLKNGNVSATPWYTTSTVSGMQDVAAIVADIAVIDPKSRVLLTNAQITTIAGGLSDVASGMLPGQLRTNWQTYLNGNTTLPRAGLSPIRLYERYLYLSPPTL